MYYIVDLKARGLFGYPDGVAVLFVNLEDARCKASFAQHITGHPCPVVEVQASMHGLRVIPAPWLEKTIMNPIMASIDSRDQVKAVVGQRLAKTIYCPETGLPIIMADTVITEIMVCILREDYGIDELPLAR